jgi:hypothetical protein
MNAMRARYLAKASGPSMETGKPFLRFVTPGDVRDLKNRVDSYVRALDESVVTCATLPPGVRDGWAAFSETWRTYYGEEDSWWHTGAQMDQGEAYESDVQRWQQMITGYKCAPNAPPITPEDDGGQDSDRWTGTIRTVAIAGAVFAVALGLRAVMK